MIRIPRMYAERPVQVAPRLFVWPLTGICPWEVGFCEDVKVVDERGFDVLVVTAERDSICPEGMAFFFDVGQDRVSRQPYWVPRHETADASVYCIQPGDSRSWTSGEYSSKMLPASFRGMAPENQLSARWDQISSRASSVGESAGSIRGLLEAAPLVRERAQFGVSCRGAIFQIDGRVVGLEIAPSPEQFDSWLYGFGLMESYQWEAENASQKAIPIGAPEAYELEWPIDVTEEFCEAKVAGLEGWVYWREEMVVYASLVSPELRE